MDFKERGFTVGDLLILFLIIFFGLFIFMKTNGSKNKTFYLPSIEVQEQYSC